MKALKWLPQSSTYIDRDMQDGVSYTVLNIRNHLTNQ